MIIYIHLIKYGNILEAQVSLYEWLCCMSIFIYRKSILTCNLHQFIYYSRFFVRNYLIHHYLSLSPWRTATLKTKNYLKKKQPNNFWIELKFSSSDNNFRYSATIFFREKDSFPSCLLNSIFITFRVSNQFTLIRSYLFFEKKAILLYNLMKYSKQF